MWKQFMRLLEQAGEGAAGGGAAAAASAAAAAAAAAGGAAAGGAAGSALAGGAAAGGADAHDWAPEKYRVKKADGTLDVEATARKVGGGYKELDTRMKTAGLPPESADKYEITVADDVKPIVDELVKDPAMKEFMKGAHAAGYSNKQMSFALEQYAKIATALAEGGAAVTPEECTAELRKSWKTTQDYDKNVASGYRAAVAFGGQIGVKFEDIEAAGLANNPLFIRIMSAVGGELAEDVAPLDAGQGGASAQTFEVQTTELRNQLKALDVHDPKRKDIQAKLDALYARKYPSRQPMLAAAPK